MQLFLKNRFFYKLRTFPERNVLRLSKKGIRLANCTKCQQVGQAPGDGIAGWDWSGRYLARCGGRFLGFASPRRARKSRISPTAVGDPRLCLGEPQFFEKN